MKILRPNNNAPKEKGKGNLRNFDLTVDEIRLMKSIDEMNNTAVRMEQRDPQSPRIKYIQQEIQKLNDQLDDLRDNTLIS